MCTFNGKETSTIYAVTTALNRGEDNSAISYVKQTSAHLKSEMEARQHRLGNQAS